MTDETNTGNNPPVATLRDGKMTAKVWRNERKDGEAFYTASFGRLYNDRNGDIKESRSFSDMDLLKLEKLAGEARVAIKFNREQDKAMQPAPQEQAAPKEQGLSLAEQREAVMQGAAKHAQSQADMAPQQVRDNQQRPGCEPGQ